MLEVVHSEALHILGTHQPPPLPPGTERAIEEVVAEAGRALV
jgi:hypothetical protein